MKTFIMLIPKTGYAIEPEDIQSTIKFIGLMNTDLENMDNEVPSVSYNGTLTNDQKKSLAGYLRSINEKGIVPIFIEYNETTSDLSTMTLIFKPSKK